MSKRTLGILVALLAAATSLKAQERDTRPEIRPFGGALMATGVQRALFQDAPLFGVQAALEVEPYFHVLGTLGWAPAQTRFVIANAGVNIFDYNTGIEVGLVQALGGRWEVKPFLGLGGGLRTYLYRGVGMDDKTCATAYAAAGTEFQLSRTALRLEVRANMLGFRSPVAGVESQDRLDVGLAFGIAYHIR
jgi:hypothetical protein